MASIIFYPQNILEDGTVTVTGDPDTGYPETRLYDRSIDFYWKDTATGAYTFHVDQGASGNIAIDFLAIEGHNFDGKDMQWQWSDNDSDWTDAVTDWAQSGNGQIIKTISSAITHRYWRVTVSSLTNPQCTEIHMSLGYSFRIMRNPNPTENDIDNVQWNQLVGGASRSTKTGNVRRYRKYSFSLSASELTDIKSFETLLDEYSKPFYVYDHDGNYWLARFDGIPIYGHVLKTGNITRTTTSVNLIEEL